MAYIPKCGERAMDVSLLSYYIDNPEDCKTLSTTSSICSSGQKHFLHILLTVSSIRQTSMADTSNKDSTFNILGSSKLNTVDGKNPSTNPAGKQSGAAAQGDSRTDTDSYKNECIAAHNALEDRLREKERLARWKRE